MLVPGNEQCCTKHWQWLHDIIWGQYDHLVTGLVSVFRGATLSVLKIPFQALTKLLTNMADICTQGRASLTTRDMETEFTTATSSSDCIPWSIYTGTWKQEANYLDGLHIWAGFSFHGGQAWYDDSPLLLIKGAIQSRMLGICKAIELFGFTFQVVDPGRTSLKSNGEYIDWELPLTNLVGIGAEHRTSGFPFAQPDSQRLTRHIELHTKQYMSSMHNKGGRPMPISEISYQPEVINCMQYGPVQS